MKKLLFILIGFLSLTASAQVEKIIPPAPNPPRLVNDLTNRFLTPEQTAALEQKLVAYDDSTSNQIAVVIVNDLQGYSAADYAIALGRKWGVGNKNFENGVVMLVSTGGGEGNRDVFIAPGYGLEGAVTDLIADAIIDNELVPNFRAGNYYRGLDEATDAIIRAAQGRYQAPEGYGSKSKKGIPIRAIIFIIILLVVLFGGMAGGGGGGGYVSRRGYTGWGGLGGLGGLGGGGGGGWSGGGGGGFGGFGGGGFGGGGAGGKW